jgi:UDP-glucose 6-dehydrogenase
VPEGFDDSIVREVIKLVGKGKVAVIKSTIIPGTAESIQKENKDIFVMHSPEFLTEVTAAYDAEHPDRNIIGIPIDNKEFREKAEHAGQLAQVPVAAAIADEALEHLLMVEEMSRKQESEILFNLTLRQN